MKRINEDIEIKNINDFLNEQLQSEEVSEGVKDWARKAINYLKQKFTKIGGYFVALWNEMILPAVAPATSQLLLKNNRLGSPVNYIGTSEDKKLSGCSTNYGDCAASRTGSYMDQLQAAYNKYGKKLVHEGKYDSLFKNVINEHYESLETLEEAMSMSNPDPNFAFSNMDAPMLKTVILSKLKKPLSSMPLLIWGAPGIGKTAVVNAVCESIKGARLIDCPLSQKTESDFTLPAYVYDEDGKKIGAEDLPKTWLPLYKVTGDKKKDEAADKATGQGVLFLDEITRANNAVQNIALKLINERKFGDDLKIGSGWAIIAAANRLDDDPDTNNELGHALGNRFMHVNYTPSVKSWRKWAETQDYMSKDILDWLECNEKYFYWVNDDEDAEGSPLYATPRSWALACQELCNMSETLGLEGKDVSDLPDEIVQMVIGSVVGAPCAKAFAQFISLKRSVDLKALRNVWKDGKKAPLPETKGRADLGYIFTSTIVAAMNHEPTSEEFSNFVDYLIRLQDESLMARALKLLFSRYPDMNKKLDGEVKDDPEYLKYYDAGQRLITAYPEFELLDDDAIFTGKR